MKSWFKNSLARKWLFVLPLWIAGLLVIYWATPEGPREGWKIPGETVLGLQGGSRLLTGDINQNQAVFLREYQNGKLIRELTREMPDRDQMDRLEFLENCDRLMHVHTFRAKSPLSQAPPTNSNDIPPSNRECLVRYLSASSGEILASWRIQHANAFLRCSPSSDGARFAALELNSEGKPQIVIYEVSTGKPIRFIQEVPGNSFLYLSQDGKRLITSSKLSTNSMTVRFRLWDVEGEKELMGWDGNYFNPEFSPDGRTVFVEGEVRDLATGQLLFQRQGPGWQCTHTGKHLMGLVQNETFTGLVFLDSWTGEEDISQRIPFSLESHEFFRYQIRSVAGQQRFVIVQMNGYPRHLLAVVEWLTRIPGFGWLGRVPDDGLILDLVDKKVVYRGPQQVILVGPDGRSFLSTGQDGHRFWDIPPRRYWISFFLGMAIWSLLLWLIQYRVFMKLQAFPASRSN